MKVIITFKLCAETRGELIDTFGAQYREFRQVIEEVTATGGFGLPPEKILLRWLVESGRWE